jgi:hypothetical protein
MWIIPEQYKVAVWNKRHFEENNTEIRPRVSVIQYGYLLNKYFKCSIWRLAVRYDIYIYGRQRVSVPCIAWLGITDQHYALIIIPLFITQAPTCFDTYVSSSGSVYYPCELLKVRNCCVIRMYPCTVYMHMRSAGLSNTKPQHPVHTNIYSTGVHPYDTTISDFK